MGGLGAPSAVIRFACHVPMGLLAFIAKSQSDLVHKHATELLDHRFNHNIGRGERVLYLASMFGFWWNFLLWIPTAMAPGALLFAIGLVDLGIVVGLTTGVCLQSTYLPHSKGPCRRADTWQVSNGTESWFHAYAIVSNSTNPQPRKECEDLVETWILGVAMAVVYLLSALFNIILGGSNTSKEDYRNYGTPQPIANALLKTVGTLLASPAFILRAILPKTLKAKLRYVWRYFLKLTKLVRPAKIKATRLRSIRPLRRKITIDNNAESLAHVLNLDVLTLIAYKLHYVDLVNLSVVSSSVRQAVFPDSAVAYNAEHFRIATCDAGTKSQCWGCNIQVCASCTLTANLTRTISSFHVDRCKPKCSDCYYKNTCREKWWKVKCGCGKGNRQAKYSHTGGIWSGNVSTPQYVCRNCSKLPIELLLENREAREKDELVRLSRQPLSCSGCKLPLGPKGPRWWVCGACQGECSSSVHPAWAPKLSV